MSEQRILSRVWLLVNTQKKCDYLGCKCVVLTLFRAFEYDISTNKKYRELFLRTRECVLRTLFLSRGVPSGASSSERFFPHSFSSPHLFYIHAN